MCNDIQTCGVLSGVNRGFEAVVATAFEKDLEDSTCTYCGQCVAVCPVGALSEADHTWKVVRALADPSKKVIVQVAPAVRAALGEEFGMPIGTNVEGEMVSGLKKLGFDGVFDTNWAADLTIMEEASELKERLGRYLDGDKKALPILTSCCPAWVKFFEHNYPDMLDVPSSAKSPQQMFGAIAKNVWAKEEGIAREDLVVVSVMPCLAKKYEASREEFNSIEGIPDVDISISTRELAKLFKQANIELNKLPKGEWDQPLGASTGAAVIFGRTGGVIEAATRTAYEWLTGETLEKVDFESLRGFDGFRAATVKVGDLDIRIGIAHGLGEARKMLDKIRAGEEEFHAIEIMACKGGCVGGGGQPYHNGNFEIIKKRTECLNTIDENAPIRKSHENPYIKEMYDKHLGEPMGELAHKILHTHYFKRNKI
jgi:NADH-quinone oxidoreductase subunit G/NADP-reducing hydrogenase subunit HndD